MALLMGCANSGDEHAGGSLFGSGRERVAAATKTLSIARASGGVAYEFGRVLDVLPLPDGSVWVIDVNRVHGNGNASIRMFDSNGAFVRQVGRAGSGPGEYNAPYGMALLNDGRVAVRDNGAPERILLYQADGSFDADMITDGRTGWPRLFNFRWASGQFDAIQADAFGVIWLPFDPITIDTDSATVFSSRYARVRYGGQFIDVVDSPELPMVASSRVTWKHTAPSGVASIRGLVVPYQPTARFALSPRANFAVVRTDRYHVDILDLQVVRDPNLPSPAVSPGVMRVIERTVPPVADTTAEQNEIRAKLTHEIAARHLQALVNVPPPAKSKPAIAGLRYSDDGQLLVWVAQPSVLVNGVWTGPQAIDVFDLAGHYTGRIKLPASVSLIRLTGNTMWCVNKNSAGVSTPERYSIQW